MKTFSIFLSSDFSEGAHINTWGLTLVDNADNIISEYVGSCIHSCSKDRLGLIALQNAMELISPQKNIGFDIYTDSEAASGLFYCWGSGSVVINNPDVDIKHKLINSFEENKTHMSVLYVDHDKHTLGSQVMYLAKAGREMIRKGLLSEWMRHKVNTNTGDRF